MVPAQPSSLLRVAGLVFLSLCVLGGAIYSAILPAVGRFPDEFEYLHLSDHLLNGPGFSMDGVHLTAMRSIGYPLFLAAMQAVGGGMVFMRIVQYLLFAATLYLTSLLLPEKNRGAGLLVITIVVTLYPVLFYTVATLYPQTLAGFLFVLALWLLLRKPGSLAIYFITGLVFGALLEVVPTFALTLVVVLAVAWWLKIVRWHDAIPVLVGATLVILPWTARNEFVFHKLVPFASNSGENLLIGNCENTTPYGGSGNVDRSRYADEARARHLDEFEEDAFYKQAAVTWIKNNPGRAFVLYLEKTANYFNVYNAYAPGTNAEVSPWKQVVMGATYLFLLALLAWRLAEWKQFPLEPREKLFLLVYVLSAFTMAIFVTRIRYRLPYDYLVIAVVAGHLTRRLQLWLDANASTKST